MGSADAIFVFSGRESRKRYGVRLFQNGVAPRLILSVGRFEWRRFGELGLAGDGGLVDLVSNTEPELRHFFVDVRGSGVRCERIRKEPLGTWSEARALARFVEREGIDELAVLSHRQHLKRCLLCLRVLLPRSVRVVPLVSPPAGSLEAPSGGIRETLKFLSYATLLGPAWLRNRFLRSHLRQDPIPGIKAGLPYPNRGFEKETIERQKPRPLPPLRELRRRTD
jgi:hypothetical protein